MSETENQTEDMGPPANAAIEIPKTSLSVLVAPPGPVVQEPGAMMRAAIANNTYYH